MGRSNDTAPVSFIIILLVLLYICVSCSSIATENEIYRYEIIVIDGIEYRTDDITSIDVGYRQYDSDIVTITFKDGTEIQTGQYTLKNKGE